jgi:peroxiredoxin Q/BCP
MRSHYTRGLYAETGLCDTVAVSDDEASHMRYVVVLSAVMALASVAVAVASGSRTGLADPHQGEPTGAPTRSPSTAETEPEEGVTSLPLIQQNEDDEPDRTELILWTLAASAAAAVLALIGYIIRLRVGSTGRRPATPARPKTITEEVNMPLKVGDPAPEFSLRDTNRNKVSLAEFKGQKAVVLAFYILAFTPGWALELKCFRDVARDFEEAGAQVLGVSVDPFPSQGAFAKELEVTFPLLSDWPNYQTAKDYEVWRESPPLPARVTYVIDKEGVIRGVIESETDMELHSREALRIVKEIT